MSIVLSTGLSMLGSVGLGELSVVVLEEGKTYHIERNGLERGENGVCVGLEGNVFPVVSMGCECICM